MLEFQCPICSTPRQVESKPTGLNLIWGPTGETKHGERTGDR